MNSIINAASSVGEVIWGKSETPKSGEEPPNETPPEAVEDGSDSKHAPYDPGNSIDTAPSPTTSAPPKDGGGDGITPVAIPAPGNAEQPIASPTEGAGPTKTEETEASLAKAKAEENKDLAPSSAAHTEGGAGKLEEVKKEETTETPSKKTSSSAAATPDRGRSDSPASGTPGSGRRGLRDKLKEKLHIGSGSQSPSGRKTG